jgi:hypothetical protein
MANNNDLDKKLEYFENIKSKREKWNNIWDELKKYVCPQTESNKNIFDSTSIWSREQLASGLQSLMVNPAMNWFNLKIDEPLYTEEPLAELPEVKVWTQNLEQTIFTIFNNPASNFYNQIHEFFLNLAAFGTSIFYVEEDPSITGGLFFRNINLKECYFEENKFGQVDSLYRLFTLSAKVAASIWPDDKTYQEKALKAPDEPVEILHIVSQDQSRGNGNSKRQSKRQSKGQSKSNQYGVTYISEYIDLAESKLLSQGNYSYFPYLVTRWIKEEGEPYGYAPAHHVLPDIKLLNSLRQITLKVAQKQLDPPLLVPKDGYYLPLYTTPGSVNFYRNGIADKIIPLTGMENIMPTEVEQNQCRDAIYKAFYVDIFRMQKENKEMTAAEVQIRNEEQMRMMAPMVGRIETEALNPLINIVYQILLKYNRLPEIAGLGIPENINPEYVSPLSRAQKSGQINAIEQVLGFFQRSGIVNIAPDIYDNIDWDECFKLFFDLKGAPQSLLKSEQEIMQIRQQRKMMQMQQMQQGQ